MARRRRRRHGARQGTCARVCPFVFCARQGERAEFDRNALIDGSDSDLNWLFSAPITYVQDGGFGGSALPNLGRKSHLIRKSDEDGDSSGLGRFFLWPLSSVVLHIKSNSPGPTERRRARRPWQIAIRWPLPHWSLLRCAALSRRRQFRVKNGLLRFENLTCTTTDRFDRGLIEERPFAAYEIILKFVLRSTCWFRFGSGLLPLHVELLPLGLNHVRSRGIRVCSRSTPWLMKQNPAESRWFIGVAECNHKIDASPPQKFEDRKLAIVRSFVCNVIRFF